MKTIRKIRSSPLLSFALVFAVAIGVGLVARVALADVVPPGATLTSQTATHNDASTCINANGTAQQTVTMGACGPGLFQYVTWIGNQAQATTAPVASAVATTTTNLGGVQLLFGLTATAGIGGSMPLTPLTPLKAALANTASTIVSNAAITNVTFNITGCYYCAP